MTEQRWNFRTDLDDAAFLALEVDPGLTGLVVDACTPDAAPSVLLTVRMDRMAAMGAEPEESISWAIEANGIAPEWAIKDGALDLLLHISQPAVRAGDLFVVQIATQDAHGEETSSEQRLVLVRESDTGLRAQLSYRPLAAEVVIARVLTGPLTLDQLTEEQAELVQASVDESLGPNALAWYERLAAGSRRP